MERVTLSIRFPREVYRRLEMLATQLGLSKTATIILAVRELARREGIARLQDHEALMPWFRDVATVRLEHCPSRAEARERERFAVGHECPLHNTQDRAFKERPPKLAPKVRPPAPPYVALVPSPSGRSTRTHCKHGHPWDSRNTYIHPTRQHRVCRMCMLLSQRKRRR